MSVTSIFYITYNFYAISYFWETDKFLILCIVSFMFHLQQEKLYQLSWIAFSLVF
jgi:hypothetical protein